MSQIITQDTRVVVFSSDDQVSLTNTPSFFTVALPYHLELRNGNAGIMIETCHFHNLLDEINVPANQKVVYFKVFCNQVNSQNLQDSSLCTLNRPEIKNEHIFFEPKVRNIYPLYHNYVDYLTFRIIGYNYLGESVSFKLLPGQPTIFQLLIVNMSTTFPEATIPMRMESHGMYNEFAETNQSNNFRINHGQMYNLDPDIGTYEVALSDITFIPTFDLPGGRVISAQISGPDNIEYRGSFKLAANDLKSADDLVNTVKRGLTKIIVDKQEDLEHVYTQKQLPVITRGMLRKCGKLALDWEKDADNHKITVQATSLTEEDDLITIYMPSIIWQLMGLGNSVEPTLERLDNLPVEVLHLSMNELVTGEQPCNPDSYQPNVGFIYCDFIKPVLCGGQTTPMLKLFDVKASSKKGGSDYKTIEFQRLDFHELSKYDLTTMHFTLRDTSGRLLNFKKPQHNIILTLQLKPKHAH